MNVELRTAKTSAEQALADAFAAARPRLPGGAIGGLRDRAFARFTAQGLPSRRVEQWKYTDLRALWREAKSLAALPDAAAKAKANTAAAEFIALGARRIVIADGALVRELSDLAPEPGLAIGSMAEALAHSDPLVMSHVGTAFGSTDVAVALNTALMSDGVVIHVAAGAKIGRPLHLVFLNAQNAAVVTRSLVVVDSGASIVLIESHESGTAQVNTALDVIVGDGATFDHYKTTRAGALHLSSLLALVGAKAKFNTFALTADAALVRNQLFVRYAGEGTESSIGGATLLRGREHVDTTLVIEHIAPGCTSRERFRAVLDGESRGVFQGKITVQPQAQQTDAKMASHALLLSDDAESDNKPELEIFADDVQCGHGATAGALQEDLLFYLRARGIPYKEAEALLVQAFIGEAIETAGRDDVRAVLMDMAIRWLEARA